MRNASDQASIQAEHQSDSLHAIASPGAPLEDDLVLLRGVEVARVLGVSRSKVYQMMSDGTLPVLRIGRAVRVPKRALAKWVDHNTTSAT
jgi:excisionase family DNA binding protein